MADATPLPDAPALGSAAEASAVLHVSRSQVYRLMDEGVIESVRVGGRRLVVWESVSRLLDQSGAS